MSEAFRLSQQQLQIWRCHTQLMEGCSQWLLRLEGALDQARLQAALDQVVQQHEDLRHPLQTHCRGGYALTGAGRSRDRMARRGS